MKILSMPGRQYSAIRLFMNHRQKLRQVRFAGFNRLSLLWLAGVMLGATSGSAADNPLSQAAARGDTAAIQRLVAQNPDLINQYDAANITPLHAAAHAGHRDAILILINFGADISAREPQLGLTPLLMAITGNQPAAVQALVSQGADVNAAADTGATPLHMAAYTGQRGIVEYLLARGAEVNVFNQAGQTPLEWALSNNQQDIARLLTQAGARMPTVKSTTVISPAASKPEQPAQIPDSMQTSDIVRMAQATIVNTPVTAAPQPTLPEPAATTKPLADPDVLRMEIEEAAQWIAELQTQLNKTRTELKNTRNQLTTEIVQRQHTVAELETSLQQTQSEAELYRRRFESAVLEKLEQEQKLRDEIERMREIHENMLKKVTDQLNQVQTGQTDKAQRISALEQQIESATSANQAHRLEIADLNVKLATAAARLQAGDQQVRQRAAELVSAAKLKAEQEKTITELQAERRRLNRMMETERQEYTERLIRAEQEIVQLKERILQMSRNLHTISQRLREREAEVRKLQEQQQQKPINPSLPWDDGAFKR